MWHNGVAYLSASLRVKHDKTLVVRALTDSPTLLMEVPRSLLQDTDVVRVHTTSNSCGWCLS